MSSASKKKATGVSFKQVLQALVDKENIFPAGFTHKLSDLDQKQVADLKAIWGQIPLERRRSLLEDMDDFGSTEFLLNFGPVARLALDDMDGIVRSLGVRILGVEEEPLNAPIFFKLLNDDADEAVRATAALAFSPLIYAGEMDEIPAPLQHQIEDALLEKIHGKDSDEVRRRALEALGYSSRPEIPGLITEAYQNGQEKWMISALFAMGRSASLEWAPQVHASLEDDRPLVRAEAASAAGEMELKDALPALLGLLDDSDSDVRAATIWSLSQIGGEGVRDRLQGLLDDSEDDEETELLEEALENLDFNEEFLPTLFDLEDMDDEEMGDDDDEEEPPLQPGRSKRPN